MDHDDQHGQKSAPPAQTDPADDTTYKIGYGKPPVETRFKSNQTGNRKGRPRGSKNRKTIVTAIANETHMITEDGRRQLTLELMLLTLRNLAAGGNVRAFRYYNELLAKYDPEIVDSEAGVLVAPAEMTPEEWIAEQEELNKTRKPPPGYEG